MRLETKALLGSLQHGPRRADSFLFFALAALAASAIGGDVTVHVPENGLISLNVPLDPLRLGALSTRTTHPFFMARFGDILGGLGLQVHLENRYRHQTKGEMVGGCANRAFLWREAKNTMSCSSPTKARWAKREPMHCGHCVPCLIRRASLATGFGADDTIYGIPDLRAQVLDSSRAESEHIRSFQLALSRLVIKPIRARFDIHRPGPLIDHPHEFAEYERVYVEGSFGIARSINRKNWALRAPENTPRYDFLLPFTPACLRPHAIDHLRARYRSLWASSLDPANRTPLLLTRAT